MVPEETETCKGSRAVDAPLVTKPLILSTCVPTVLQPVISLLVVELKEVWPVKSVYVPVVPDTKEVTSALNLTTEVPAHPSVTVPTELFDKRR